MDYFTILPYKSINGRGTTDSFQIGKGVHQVCILSPCLFNFYAEYIMRNAGLEEPQGGMKIAGRNINNLRYADDTILMVESRRTKEPLDESERGERKSWLKAQDSELSILNKSKESSIRSPSFVDSVSICPSTEIMGLRGTEGGGENEKS